MAKLLYCAFRSTVARFTLALAEYATFRLKAHSFAPLIDTSKTLSRIGSTIIISKSISSMVHKENLQLSEIRVLVGIQRQTTVY